MTDSQTFFDTYPDPGTARDQMVLDAVSAGIVTINYLPITSTYQGHTATFYVCDDAARIELSDGTRFRFQTTAIMNQKIADLLNVSMVTAKILDLSYRSS